MVDVAGRELRLVNLRRGLIRRETWTFFYRGEVPKKSKNIVECCDIEVESHCLNEMSLLAS